MRARASEHLLAQTSGEMPVPSVEAANSQSIDYRFWELIHSRPQEFNPQCAALSEWRAEDRTWITRFRSLAAEVRDKSRAQSRPELDENDWSAAAMTLKLDAIYYSMTDEWDIVHQDLVQLAALLRLGASEYSWDLGALTGGYLGLLREDILPRMHDREALRAWLPFVEGFDALSCFPGCFANLKLAISLDVKEQIDCSYRSMVNRLGTYQGTRTWLWLHACGPLLNQDIEVSLQYCDRLYDATSKPYFESVASLAQLRQELTELSAYFNKRQWLGTTLGLYEATIAQQQEARLLYLACMIEISRAPGSAWPDSLDAFRDDPVRRTTDLFDGKPLRYQLLPNGSGFQITSSGPDGVVPSDDDVSVTWPIPDPCILEPSSESDS